MKNKKLIYFFAITLSIIFSIIYLLVFKYYIPSHEDSKTASLYVNQIGLYKEKANADKILSNLQSHQIEGYIYKKKDIYVVVCGVSDNQEDSKKVEASLKKQSLSYIAKKIDVKDDTMVAMIAAKQYQQVLELIGNQS